MKLVRNALIVLMPIMGIQAAQVNKGSQERLVNTSSYGNGKYSQDDLVAVHAIWSYQENRLVELKCEAENTKVAYLSGSLHVATINGTDKTITTYLPGFPEIKSITLSYESLNKLLADKVIINLANIYLAFLNKSKR